MAASDTALRDTCQRDVPTSLLQTAKATDKETLRRDSHIHLFRSRWALWHGPGPFGKKLPVTCVVSKSCEVCLVGSKQNFRRIWSISSTDSDIPVFWIFLRICYVWWSAWCFFGEVFWIKATDRPVTGSHRCVLCALHLNQDVLCCDMVRQVPSSIRRCHNDNQLETQTYVVFCAHPIILQHVTIKQRMPSAVEQPNEMRMVKTGKRNTVRRSLQTNRKQRKSWTEHILHLEYSKMIQIWIHLLATMPWGQDLAAVRLGLSPTSTQGELPLLGLVSGPDGWNMDEDGRGSTFGYSIDRNWVVFGSGVMMIPGCHKSWWLAIGNSKDSSSRQVTQERNAYRSLTLDDAWIEDNWRNDRHEVKVFFS